jgi:Spy/CpxP family protein refolding chaperone
MDPAPPPTTSTSTTDGRRGPGGPGDPAGRADELLLRSITLDVDQQRRVDSIRAAYRAQTEQLRQQSGADRQAMRTQMRSLMEHLQTDVRAVLSADQQAVFDKNVADIRARMQQRGGQRGPAN